MVKDKAAQAAEDARKAQEASQAPIQPPAVSAPQTGLGGGWAALRQCESGGKYNTNTGNGYYGAYQYDDSSWNGYGGYQHASDAPPATQDQKAQETYAARGSSPWPVCGKSL